MTIKSHHRILALALGAGLVLAGGGAHAWVAANTCYGRAVAWDIDGGDRYLPRVLRCTIPVGSDEDAAYQNAITQIGYAAGWDVAHAGPDYAPTDACVIDEGDGTSELGLVDPSEIDGNRGFTTYESDSCVLPGDFQRIKAAHTMIANDLYFGPAAYWSAVQENGFGVSGKTVGRFAMLHEMGHALGLGHSPALAVMNVASLGIPMVGGPDTHEEMFPDDTLGLHTIYSGQAGASVAAGNFFASAQKVDGNGVIQKGADPFDTVSVCPGDSVTPHFTFGNMGLYNQDPVTAQIFISNAWPGYSGGTVVGTWDAHMPPHSIGTTAWPFTVPNVAPGYYHIYLQMAPGHQPADMIATDNVVYGAMTLNVKDTVSCLGPDWPTLGTWVQTDSDLAPPNASYAVVNNSHLGDKLDLYVIGGDHAVYRRTGDGTPASNWTGYVRVTTGWIKKIAAVDSPYGVFLFGIGGDDKMYMNEPSDTNGGYAYGWVKMDDHTVTDIAAALNGVGWVDLFGRTTDGRIGHMFQFHQSGQPTSRLPWTSFFLISDGTVALDGLALGWQPKVGLVAWAIGSDGNLWSNAEIMSTNSYGNWVSFGDWGTMGRPEAGSPVKQVVLANTANDDGGRLTVFTVDASGNIFRNVWHEALFFLNRMIPAHWTGWEQLPMYGKRQIAVANNGENFAGGGRLEVFAVDSTDSVQHVWQTATNDENTWGGPANRYGNVRAVMAGHNPDGRIEIFGMKADHRVMHDWENWSMSTNWQY